MENLISIQPIAYGLNESAILANLTWISKPFFSDNVCLRIELLNEDNEILDFKDVHMSMDDYVATGADKRARAESIMNSNGIYLVVE